MGTELKVGVILPQIEIGGDVGAVRAYAEAVTELGYSHILVYDHVLGADPDVYQGWEGPYDVDSTFHEPFVLFGHLAAITPLELVCGIIILPQRQTALVAKQAAEIDILSRGRFRLGVGLGWNPVEFEALGADFSNRGARIGEQVQLLRLLWTQRSVSFDGRYEKVLGAGIAPPPIQRPIPIWFGANSEPALRRAGRLADGWFPRMNPGPELDAALRALHEGAREAGRDPSEIAIEGRLGVNPNDVERLVSKVESWKTVGASHVTLDTMRRDLDGVDGHIEALRLAAEALALTER
jgi:probable F420-dependent oxidoreductase